MTQTTESAHIRPLLRQLAGSYARAVAAIWPSPHEAYFSLDAQRRHLMHLCVARVLREPPAVRAAFAQDLVEKRIQDFMRCWAADAPPGLVSMAAKLGENAWKRTQYQDLIVLLRDSDEVCEPLSHALSITPALVEVVSVLPASLRRRSIVKRIQNHREAYIVAQCVALVRFVHGPQNADAAERALAERLKRCGTRERFFFKIMEAMRPVRFVAPFEPTGLLQPLLTVRDMDSAARRFNNCLVSCIPRAAFGQSAFVEWCGAEPAMIELVFEGALGWRVETVLGDDNEQVSEATRAHLIACLEQKGVRVGKELTFLVSGLQECMRRSSKPLGVGGAAYARAETQEDPLDDAASDEDPLSAAAKA